MLSGSGRVETPPPWDLELMAAGYLVALGPCLALLLGALLAFADFVRKPRAERFLLIAVLGATCYALLNMTLRLPFYTQAKAFYGLSALVPLAFCFALGFDALALRVRALRTARHRLARAAGRCSRTRPSSAWTSASRSTRRS